MPGSRWWFRRIAGLAAPALAAGLVLAASVEIRRPPAAPPAPGPSRIRPVPSYPPPGVVEIRRRDRDPTVSAPAPDGGGGRVEVACASCHGSRPPSPRTRASADLDLFHQGLDVAHGGLACVACHAAPAYDALHLASGERVAYPDAQRLCAQCHGPQHRDYTHGSHGGMNGYWDLTRGGRIRNGCLDCHDAHAPRFPILTPARGPNDRFLRPAHAAGSDAPPHGSEGGRHP